MAAFHDRLERPGGCAIPNPRVFESANLSGRSGFAALFEQDIVVLIAVKWRIEINEIDALVLHIAAQDVEVIAVVEVIQLALAQKANFIGMCGIGDLGYALRINRRRRLLRLGTS